MANHTLFYNIIILTSLYIDIILSLPIVSTSITPLVFPIRETIVGYSELTKQISIIGGIFQGSGGVNDKIPNPGVWTANLETGFILYDENNAPIQPNDTSNVLQYNPISPNIIADPGPLSNDITTQFFCKNQCATQMDNLLYVINPNTNTVNNFGVSLMMVIYNVDTISYIPQSNYSYNVPNAGDWNAGAPACVVNDGNKIFVLGNRLSSLLTQTDPQCPGDPDGANVNCPITELYTYTPSTDSWSARGNLSEPNINYRYRTGCAISPDNQYLYIFGGIKRIDPTDFIYDTSIRETEKYEIATDSWTQLPPGANLREARWSMNSFVSFTDNNIYLYGGFRASQAKQAFTNLDSKVMTVFDLTTESMLMFEDGPQIGPRPEWNSGHWLELSNTIPIRNLCPYEIGLDVGSLDFSTFLGIDDISLLRFTSSLQAPDDGEISINSLTDIPNITYDAYGEHLFQFEIIVTSGALFIPNTDINNYDFLVTDWIGRTWDIQSLQRRYSRAGAGNAPIVTIESVTATDVNLLNACNAATNIVQRLEVNIRIRARGGRRSLCGQTRPRRLRRWFFRESDPNNDGVNEWTSSIQLEIINPSDNSESVISDTYSLVHDCTIN